MTVKLLSTTDKAMTTGNNNRYPGKPITETINNGFFTVDHKWTVKYWNKAAENLLGVQAKNIVGKNLWEEFAGTIPLDFYMFYHKAFLRDVPVHFEEYWGEMGTWFDVITYHSGDILSVSFKSSNQPAIITERPEQQLDTLNQLYKFVTEVTNDCLWEWNLEAGELFWIDGGHKRVFGYPIENTLIPQSFWENCLHPDDKARILSGLSEAIARGTDCLWEDEYRFKRIDGEYVHVHDRGHIIYENDKAARMIGATQDISARKSAELQLLESERKLSLIARQTLNAVIITDAEGKITWVNSAFSRITEYEAEEVMGRKPGSFLQGKETSPSTVQYLRQKIKAKQPFDCEIINYSKSGRKFWIRIQGQPLLNENGSCERYFAMETDITEKMLLEDKLTEERLTKQREITDAVLTAQENERVSMGKELHDNVNQVLAMAKLYVQMAKKDEKNRGAYLDESCGFIINAIEEIRTISQTLIIPGMHSIGLFDSIKFLLNDLVKVHPIKIKFDENGIDEEKLNEKQQLNIFRIVQAQLNNILQHAKATAASIDLRMDEKEIILVISDNGVGFDASGNKKGVGIRNIMSRAEVCHGSAEIESKPGKGFQLKVILPYPYPTGITDTMATGHNV